MTDPTLHVEFTLQMLSASQGTAKQTASVCVFLAYLLLGTYYISLTICQYMTLVPSMHPLLYTLLVSTHQLLPITHCCKP